MPFSPRWPTQSPTYPIRSLPNYLWNFLWWLRNLYLCLTYEPMFAFTTPAVLLQGYTAIPQTRPSSGDNLASIAAWRCWVTMVLIRILRSIALSGMAFVHTRSVVGTYWNGMVSRSSFRPLFLFNSFSSAKQVEKAMAFGWDPENELWQDTSDDEDHKSYIILLITYIYMW